MAVEQEVLRERIVKLAAQRDQLVAQLSRLGQARVQAEASLNAVIGAIAVLEDVVAQPDAEKAPVDAPPGNAPRPRRGRRATLAQPNGADHEVAS